MKLVITGNVVPVLIIIPAFVLILLILLLLLLLSLSLILLLCFLIIAIVGAMIYYHSTFRFNLRVFHGRNQGVPLFGHSGHMLFY